MSEIYSIKDVAKIFGLQESRLRYWAQTGFVNPSVRQSGRWFYTFGDLVNVRAAKDLLDAGLTLQRVRKTLEALRAILPDVAQPASRMHICSDGETIVAVDAGVVFEPCSGQIVMEFTVDGLSRQVADILALPTSDLGAEIPDLPAGVESRTCHGVLAHIDDDDGHGDRQARGQAHAHGEDDAGVGAENPDWPMSHGGELEFGLDAVPQPIGDEPTVSHMPESPYRAFLQGCEAEDRGNLDTAEVAYRRALELQPSLAAAHTNLGNLMYRRGDVTRARAAYERAIELEPNQPEARYNLGNVLEDMGETELAIAELRRVCWMHPEFADAHYNLGLMLARVGGVSQAQEHLQRYIALDRASEWTERARTFLSAIG